MKMEFPNCAICGCALNFDIVNVGVKGQRKLVSSSEKRKDKKFTKISEENIKVHSKCRAAYINERCIQSAAKKHENQADESPFDYQKQCLFCSNDASESFIRNEIKKPKDKRMLVCSVLKQETGDNIVCTSLDENNDLCKEVRSRVQNKDLVRLNARYHKLCYTKFLQPNKPIHGKRGRPISEEIEDKMRLVFDYIDSNMDDAQFSIEEIRNAINVDLPDNRTIKRKLIDNYGENMLVIDSKGKPTIFCFVSTCKQILQDKWYSNRETDEKTEKMRIIQTAANIVLEDIRSIPFDTQFYPSPASFLEEVEHQIPDTLKTFIKTVITKYKNNPEKFNSTIIALSHSIITAARPRSFRSPLLLGISSLIHQKYASKTLIDILSSIGFCTSYKEVINFEVSSIFHPQKEVEPEFKQFVFDNADFNTQTLDGHHTFHSMGGIQCNTPKDITQDTPILKLTTVPRAAVVGKYGNTPLQQYFNHGRDGLKNKTILNLIDDYAVKTTPGDALWLYGKSEPLHGTPGWNAFMSTVYKDSEYAVSEIQPLPFINAQPSDYDTIYTALKEALNKTNGACIVTFDQPLYNKAQEIVNAGSELNNVILRLGGFHLLMSFMGSIGYIMSGSGLKELWCTIYAAVSTEKMLSGHSYARALRAHFLSRTALFRLLVNELDLTYEEKLDIEEVLENIQGDDLIKSSQLNIDSPSVNKLQEQLDATLNQLINRGPTAKLWVEYFRMTTLVAQFIEAEKSGNWEMHLSTIKQMLPYFYASGHFAYAKSCTMYLQDMANIDSKMEKEEKEKFCTKGFFTIRRTNKFWAGVWTDQTIEQTLMRAMKSSGGLTRGRGVTDSVLSKWILSAPITSAISEQVENFCGVSYTTTVQHADACEARIKRDNEDLAKLLDWLQQHNPFPTTENIVSLSTGIVGGADINCHEARNVGQEMMLEKVGENFKDVKYQRKKRVLPLSSLKSSVKVDDSRVPIEPEMIFKRICFAKKNQEELKSYFEYELAPYPLPLFDENGMRKTRKSVLYELSKPIIEFSPNEDNVLYVIDGGFLLHKVVWKKGMSILAIGNMYINYVKKHFKKAVVVFDGYEEKETNTKMVERIRRAKCQVTPEILFEKSTEITTTQEKFLSNEKNKDRLIKYLKTEFHNSGISTKQSTGDADNLIVSTALECIDNYDQIFIVGEDVDLLVIMCGLTDKNNIFLMKPGRGKICTKYYSADCFGNNIIQDHIFFIHAISGCDTTSAIFRQGKKKIANLVKSDSYLQSLIVIFKDVDADPTAIANAGEQFFVRLYGDKDIDLKLLRYKHFAKSMTKSKFNLACLPPSAEAVRQHSYRAYHQIQKWLGKEKPPTEWGWKLSNNYLEPIMTSLEAAPKEILNMISCKCKNICKFNCTCKKSGLNCSSLCIYCDGKMCHGTHAIDTTDDEDSYGFEDLTGCDMNGNPLDEEPDEAIDVSLEQDQSIYTENIENAFDAQLSEPKKRKISSGTVITEFQIV